jgi:hypothetical protein
VASNNPFAGIRLSEQAQPGKLDQRLFAADPPPAKPAPRSEPSTGPDPEPTVSQTRPASTPLPTSQPVTEPVVKKTPSSLKTMPQPAPRWNLDEEPLYKATFVFTQDELNALTDLKEELRRTLDAKVTKYELIRSALHFLLEDHATNGPRSYATKKVKKH